MTWDNFIAISPVLAFMLGPIVLMLAIAVRRSHTVTALLSYCVLALTALLALNAASVAPRQLTQLLIVDNFGLFYLLLITAVTAVLMHLGVRYLANRESHPEEYYVLLLLAAGGAAIMGMSTHFASFYLGLEVLSVSQYGLVAYVRRDRRGVEAGIKYLVLAAASAAFMLFGMALVYAEFGSMHFAVLAHATETQVHNAVVLLGVAMIFVGIGFKLSVAPFHLWAPDIYEGSPVPVAAFTATVAKIGVIAILVRYFAIENTPVSESLYGVIAITAAISMLAGNLLALIQHNIKRLLAYSSIAQIGYLSVSFLHGGHLTSEGVAYYLVAYSLGSLAVFGVVMTVSASLRRPYDMERLEDFAGLYWRNKTLAIVMTIGLLSLAGIPLTAGFVGKLYMVLAGAEARYWWLLVVLAFSSVIGVYYYLRIILLLFSRGKAYPPLATASPIAPSQRAALIALSGLSILLGVFPAPLISVIEAITLSR
ncbi:MAG TPA: NADH-quinone oxidoreductase subunit N [Candidatus Hydrogenedentes bacterium]|nr:NADH-quinone oxidoreductase subunit N [Candidatus Hydrogenedentota bacterium]